jgi:hypothetical protein
MARKAQIRSRTTQRTLPGTKGVGLRGGDWLVGNQVALDWPIVLERKIR